MATSLRLRILIAVLLGASVACTVRTQPEEAPVQTEATAPTEQPGTEETAPAAEELVEIEVHLWQTYRNDKVQLAVDGLVVFSEPVTTDDSLSLAATVPIPVSEGSHRLGVTINGSLETEATFDTQDVLVIAVSYIPEEDRISFEFLDFHPAYR